MKRTLLFLSVFLSLFATGIAIGAPDSGKTSNVIHVLSYSCDSVPELNRKIILQVRQQMGKKVGRGECWDLAALVLNQNGAKWDGQYVYGRRVDPEKECIYPGDLIQFEGVRIKYTQGRTVFTESMDHHTAVINEVKAKGVFILVHQNTGAHGRKVGLSDLDLKAIIKGRYMIYRPVF